MCFKEYFLSGKTKTPKVSVEQVQSAGQPIRGLVFGGKKLGFISLSQIKDDYNFSEENSYFNITNCSLLAGFLLATQIKVNTFNICFFFVRYNL